MADFVSETVVSLVLDRTGEAGFEHRPATSGQSTNQYELVTILIPLQGPASHCA